MLAVPSPVFSRDSSKVTGSGENNPFSPYDGWQSPNTPILQINLWLTQGLKQHQRGEEGKWSILPLTLSKKYTGPKLSYNTMSKREFEKGLDG